MNDREIKIRSPTIFNLLHYFPRQDNDTNKFNLQRTLITSAEVKIKRQKLNYHQLILIYIFGETA